MEKFVKVLDRFVPFYFSLGYFVEFPFDLRREIIVENIGEMFGQEIVYDDTYVGRQQFAFFRSENFGFIFIGDFPIFEC